MTGTQNAGLSNITPAAVSRTCRGGGGAPPRRCVSALTPPHPGWSCRGKGQCSKAGRSDLQPAVQATARPAGMSTGRAITRGGGPEGPAEQHLAHIAAMPNTPKQQDGSSAPVAAQRADSCGDGGQQRAQHRGQLNFHRLCLGQALHLRMGGWVVDAGGVASDAGGIASDAA